MCPAGAGRNFALRSQHHRRMGRADFLNKRGVPASLTTAWSARRSVRPWAGEQEGPRLQNASLLFLIQRQPRKDDGERDDAALGDVVCHREMGCGAYRQPFTDTRRCSWSSCPSKKRWARYRPSWAVRTRRMFFA
jgi:hypothetical protein